MPVISIRDVSFKYLGQKGQALNHLSLDIHGGEMLLVLGGDCSGKSTFCKLLNGLIPHEVKGEFSGEVLLNGRSTKSMSTGEIVRDVGLALQDPDVQLFTDSVEEEVAFGPENLGMHVDAIDASVSRSLKMTGISTLRGKSPSALSGGQKQRLAIASVLSMAPKVVVLDEPMSMLDPRGRVEFLQMLGGLRDEGIAVVLTSPEAEEIIPFCDRIAVLNGGSLIGAGTPAEMLVSSDGLTSLGIEPPQLLTLSESLSREGLLQNSRTFFDEGSALAALSRSPTARRP
jgi:energy-coupling factor transporter ATP-binding protein EcfA2